VTVWLQGVKVPGLGLFQVRRRSPPSLPPHTHDTPVFVPKR
jgi:hypothetical protein